MRAGQALVDASFGSRSEELPTSDVVSLQANISEFPDSNAPDSAAVTVRGVPVIPRDWGSQSTSCLIVSSSASAVSV